MATRDAVGPMTRRVLLTGAGGVMGGYVYRELRSRGHFVRGLDIRECDADESIVADVTDVLTLADAMRDVDCVIHLAAIPDDADYLKLLVPNNLVGLYNVCEAARQSETVTRLVLASSGQVVAGLPWGDKVIRLEDGEWPRNHYGLLKRYAERMGEMYSRMHGLSVIAVRLGWLPREVDHIELLSQSPAFHPQYFSGADAGRFLTCCIEASDEQVGGYQVLFATSRPRDDATGGFDLEPARRVIGYEPQDTYPQGIGTHLKEL